MRNLVCLRVEKTFYLFDQKTIQLFTCAYICTEKLEIAFLFNYISGKKKSKYDKNLIKLFLGVSQVVRTQVVYFDSHLTKILLSSLLYLTDRISVIFVWI